MPAPPKWSFAYYTRQQQIALWILLAALVIVFGWSALPRKEVEEIPADEEFWLAVETLRANDEAGPATSEPIAQETPATALFYFDPNTVSSTELESLGLNAGQARSWIRYRNSGAKFYRADDIARIWALSPEDVARLKPWVSIPEETEPADAGPERSEVANFPFDPNTVTSDELQQLGLSERQARTWISYRNSGARFERAEDIGRVYGLNAADIARLTPLISINETNLLADAATHQVSTPQSYDNRPSIGQSYESNSVLTLDVNSATTEDWQRLRGIGPYWAGRIVKFRDALGGFVAIDQIGDTYGLPDSTFQSIRPQLTLESPVEPLYINTATEEELKLHPYINARQAGALVAYRNQHGPFEGAEALRDVRLLSDADRARLVPYLNFRME
ncbi:MAG: helix-hairpin-helix domain-containing protein [Bacteroidota bacterium]